MITVNELGAVGNLTKFIPDAPGPEDIVAGIIGESATSEQGPWALLAREWLMKAMGDQFDDDTAADIKAAWMDREKVKAWLQRRYAAGRSRLLRLHMRQPKSSQARQGSGRPV